MSEVKRPRRLAGVGGFAIRMGVAAVIGVVAGVGGAIFGDQPGPLGLALTLLCYGASMLGAMLVALWWWRDIDEAAKEAHKWAWWWGGCSGMALGGVLLMTALARSEVAPLQADDTGALFAGGIMVLLLFQIIGYGIAWAVWWLKHR